MSRNSDLREEREAKAAIAKMQRELDNREAKAEAAEKMMSKALERGFKDLQENLAQEMNDGFNNGVQNDAMSRILKGEDPRTVLNEANPTGLEKYVRDDDEDF